jgi:hypothetical protein
MKRTSYGLRAASVALVVLLFLVGVAVAAPRGNHPWAPGARVAKDDAKDKSKDDKKDDGEGKGKDKGTTPAGPDAPPPPPATVAAPATTASPASPSVPVWPTPPLPGASAAPTVALDTAALTPTLAQSVGVVAASGSVTVRTGNGRPAQPLTAVSAIPIGTHVDARFGTVELTAALDATGTTQTATFSGAIFEVRQGRADKGLTQILLTGSEAGCAPTPGHARGVIAAVARRRKPIRSLWGQDDHGRFQTQGRGSVATVRGTRWLTQDFCDGTLTRVTRGSVAVRDLAKRKVIVVHAGHSYFAAR